jgi:O-Antigen ligase
MTNALTVRQRNRMIRNSFTALDTQALDTYQVPARNIWQLRSAGGGAVWAWITAAFTAYWVLFVAGAFLGRKELNAVGGVVILGVLGWVILERLWVRLDAVVIASLMAAVCIPVLQIFTSNGPLSKEALFKHVSLCLVMAASRILQLPVACKSRIRWLLALQILAILLISFTIFRGTSWDGGTRHSGLFVNPNNLALIPFLLLFFVDPIRDGMLLRLAAHAIVVAVLAFSGTSGAVVAYAIGLAVHLRTLISKRWRTFVYILIPVCGLAAVTFIAMNGAQLLPETRLTKQVEVIGVQLQNVLQGGDVAYYEQERVLGPGTASGIWRVAHWRRTVATYLDGTVAQQILGFGLGSSPRMLGKLPHNEYLRILFEQGIIGFMLFVFAWGRIIKTAPAHIRYVGLVVAIYSFSENNLDNFPFMALFTLCLSARGLTESFKVRVKQPLVRRWNTAIQRA